MGRCDRSHLMAAKALQTESQPTCGPKTERSQIIRPGRKGASGCISASTMIRRIEPLVTPASVALQHASDKLEELRQGCRFAGHALRPALRQKSGQNAYRAPSQGCGGECARVHEAGVQSVKS